MATLYVDVDDTLITWAAGPEFATEWVPNQKVFAAIERHVREFDTLVIWSLGGGQYAWDMWEHPANRPFRRPIDALNAEAVFRGFGFESKWPRIPGPGDVFIDDDPLPSFRSATIHPKDLL